MRAFIELIAINLRSERDVERFNQTHQFAETEQVVGEDDLERPIVAAAEPVTAPVLKTFATTICLDQVREFHPRQHDREGTRIVYLNGSAQIVQNEYDEVKAKFAEAYAD